MPTRRSWLAVPLAVCVAAVLGCGTSGKHASLRSSRASTALTADPSVAALVPAPIKARGTIMVASDASYAPDEFIAPDGHSVIGMDADLVQALGVVMGLKVKIVNSTFDGIIPKLMAGRYDVGASSFTDNREREKTVDFVDYLLAGESFYTRAQRGVSISGIDGICGKTVAVEKGTTELADAVKQSQRCLIGGRPPATVLSFPDQNGANLALATGRAQLEFADTPVAAYQVKQSNGQFKLVGASFETAPYGFATARNGLDRALLAALKVLVRHGTYMSILRKWGLQSGAVAWPQLKINGAAS